MEPEKIIKLSAAVNIKSTALFRRNTDEKVKQLEDVQSIQKSVNRTK